MMGAELSVVMAPDAGIFMEGCDRLSLKIGKWLVKRQRKKWLFVRFS
jgi:hypothetical protein